MNRKSLMMLMAGAMTLMSDPYRGIDINPTPRNKKFNSKSEIEDYLSKHRAPIDSRQLREFSIKGKKIMAYSRKGAITRLKQKKKK